MKSAIKSGKMKYIAVLSLITAAFVLISVFYLFGVSIVLEEDNRIYFDEIAFETANTVESRLNNLLNSIRNYSYRFTEFEGLTEAEQNTLLHETANASGFHDFVYINADGNALSARYGEAVLSNRDYFRNPFLLGTDYVSVGIVGHFTTEVMNMFSVPVLSKGEISGVLSGALESVYVKELINTDTFDGKSSSYIMNSEGLILLIPNNDILNIDAGFSLLEMAELTSGSEDAVFELLGANNAFGNFSFTFENENYFASFKSIGISEWMVITVIRTGDIAAVTFNVFGMVVIFTFISMLITSVAIIILGIRHWVFNKKFRETSDERDNFKNTDLLTGGPSFDKFITNVVDIFDKTEPDTGTYAMISMDINKFRTVNDHLGHDEGSRILIKLSELIQRNLTENETYTRKNADSFYILIKYVSDIDIFGRLDTLINDTYYQVEEFKLILSFGIYKIDDLTMDVRSIIDRADLARRTIKDNNESSYAFFDDNMLTKIREEKRIESIMEFALESNEFKVYLQPKYDLNNHTYIIGAEALVRWFRDGKMIPPGGFIPIFERNGFIVKIDRFVFEEVCKQQKIWLNRGYEMRTISVNMSRMNLQEPRFVRDLYEICTKYNVPTKYFEIEITESVAFENLETLTRVFNELKNYGFHISIDDFGTGYSSLNMLKNLPVDVLKIDRSFLADAKDERANNIISHVISLALSLHMKTICEGIETEEQVNLLSGLNCDMAQGFYFARPMPIDDYEKLLYSDNKVTS
ncbi:MAG: EAL domain-containing protein [Oscillospiraceae bacterium]|jgi:diguanylate cyclase (GGDEF)-like protein|nr:EAL domain-containing protein [Oscillospiraceae bacterium]